jgi:hypothetical protein
LRRVSGGKKILAQQTPTIPAMIAVVMTRVCSRVIYLCSALALHMRSFYAPARAALAATKILFGRIPGT